MNKKLIHISPIEKFHCFLLLMFWQNHELLSVAASIKVNPHLRLQEYTDEITWVGSVCRDDNTTRDQGQLVLG